MTPPDLQQVPLDRATQTIYARIHAAMKPLRDEVARVQESGQLLAAAFGKFRESLPTLDLSAYNAMRGQLAHVADALTQAVQVPLSAPTRTLAAQLIDHDLPRLAAIAVKLNEEDAPKFFAAINYTDSTFETFAVDAKQKTTIRMADFDAAVDQIVNRRLAEIARLIKEDTAKWLAAQGATEDPASLELCRRTPNQAFLYWKSFETDLTGCPPMGRENELKFRGMCDTFRDWFEGQGHWRDLKPNAKDLDPTDHNAHAKHKKQIEAYVATRKTALRGIEFDEVKPAHKCQHEGTEYEQVDYHWTYLLAGEPQVILTIETGNVLPPHNDALKRHYFKTSAPCGYAILEEGDRLAGAVFFPNGEHVEFTPCFDARFYPEDLFQAGDYELRRVQTKGGTQDEALKNHTARIIETVEAQPLKTAALLRGTIKQRLGTLGTVIEEDFTASPHFTNLTWRGKQYVLRGTAAVIIETLYIAQKHYAIPGFHQEEVFAQVYGSNKKDWPSSNTRIQNFFRKGDAKHLWDDGLIGHDGKGNFHLNLMIHTSTQ